MSSPSDAATGRTLARIPDPREKPWLTVAELAAITGEGQKVIRAALASGQLPCLEIGRYRRIPTAALLLALGISADSADTEAELASVHTLTAARAP